MEKEIDKKLKNLCKYIPFIDYITNVDKEKYKKFLDIKSWIVDKRRFPISDLLKIEQSFIIQYKNLFLQKLKVPEEIRKIFAAQFNHQYVNLCSDDENEEFSPPKAKNKCDDDGDLEIINIFLPTTSNSQGNTVRMKGDPRPKVGNEISTNNGTLDSNCIVENKLFKRRSDFLNEELESQIAKHKFREKKASVSLFVTEVLSFDSSASEDDFAPVVSNESAVKPKPSGIEKNAADQDRNMPTPLSFEVTTNSRNVEQDIAVSGNIECENSKTSENISNVTSRLDEENEVNNNQSISNSNNPQSNQERLIAIGGEEAQSVDMNNNEGLSASIQTPEFSLGSMNFPAAHLQEQRFLNNANVLLLPAPPTQLNSSAFHQFQCAAGGTYAGHVLNDNQYTNTTNVFHQLPYAPNLNQPGVNISGFSYPIQRKLLMNDPRILKHLQRIQNSPLAFNNARDTAANLQSVPQFPFPLDQTRIPTASWQLTADNIRQQQALGNNYKMKCADAIISKTFLEHNRRKAEKERESQHRAAEERHQKEGKDTKETAAAQQIENKELKKQQDQILSILHGREDEVQTKRNACKGNTDSTNKVTDRITYNSQISPSKSNQENNSPAKQIALPTALPKVTKPAGQSAPPISTVKAKDEKTKQFFCLLTDPQGNKSKQSSHSTITEKANSNIEQTSHSKSTTNANERKINKLFKTLECTVNGYNPFKDYVPKTLGGKRRSSVHARDIISRQLNDSDSSVGSGTSKINKSKRQRRSDIEKLRCFRVEYSSDSDADSFTSLETLDKQRKHAIQGRQPVVELQRLQKEQCLKQRNPFQELSDLNQIRIASNEQMELCVEMRSTPVEIDQNEKFTAKVSKCCRRNNDCQMTELNTRFCILCTAKPANLTNHYIKKHKTESYVSRLTSNQLDDLLISTNYAELQGPLNYRLARFKVTCPFCESVLIQPFMTLYDHYSKHTGEYAYRCITCSLTKPFRADILSHQQNSKKCRRAKLKVMYRYPPNATVIYLHYCFICNYVQLNRANILKHLREQHSPREAVASNVKKCILTAIQRTTDTQACESTSNLTNMQSIFNDAKTHDGLQTTLSSLSEIPDNVDEDMAVCNEPCVEEIELDDYIKTENHCPINANGSIAILSTTIEQEIADKVDEDMAVCNEPCVEEIELDDYIKTENDCPINANGSIAIEAILSTTIEQEIADKVDEDMAGCNEPCVEEIEVDDYIKIENHCPINANESIAILSTTIEQQPTQIVRQLKCEKKDDFEMGLVPLTQFSERARHSLSEPTFNEPRLNFRSSPANVTYLGLCKCMADDCYFSTDQADQMLSHLSDHANSECAPSDYIQCAYCFLRFGDINAAQELVNHIQLRHQHDVYQCSLCSYRSCDPSNVLIHQNLQHPYTRSDCWIYMCANQGITCDQKKSYLMMRKAENVQKIMCPHFISIKKKKDCPTEFFATYHLQKHLEVHEMATEVREMTMDVLKCYSCVYCPTSERDQKGIRIHLAVHHPNEFPFMCNHNITEDFKVDSLQSLKLVNLAEAVSPHLLRDVNGYKITDNALEHREAAQLDIKPNVMLLNEETTKARLRKLTESTGVSPENLFRCPESTCGGFFSTYELWLRHMKVRHCRLICFCPHCSDTNQNNSNREMLELKDFEAHFEIHRGHVNICFHCLDTFKYEDQLRRHAEVVHQLSEMRLEQICYNIPYAYKVLIDPTLYTERVVFLTELLKLLEKKLKELEEKNLDKLKHQWPVPNTTDWLENFPSHLYCRELERNCLQEGCKYLCSNDDLLFDHLRSVHEIIGHYFSCKQCPFQIANCDSWEPIFEHLKVHSLPVLYVCCVCSFYHCYRKGLMDHIRREHDTRDAPFVQITKKGESTFVELAIVFATGEICFSTMRNCFCCEERGMKVDVLVLHLKHYHKLRLNYYCQLCYLHLDGLQNYDDHFNEKHLNKKRKIYCTLAYHGNITVTSIQPFQICVVNVAGNLLIKCEPEDENEENSVIALDEDDIVVAKDMYERPCCEADKPVIKCVSTGNLLKSAPVNPYTKTNRFIPRILRGKYYSNS
uniref:C2H2-type domain-containing protein n=1 Tax=Glossina brevipalpis TaxID=37001 RepID=A0A1A9WW26_9MUSC